MPDQSCSCTICMIADGRLTVAPVVARAAQYLHDIAALLVTKNAAYGNSIAEPVRIFARHVSVVDAVNVRLDDKLSRLMRGDPDAVALLPEDVVRDLVGYLALRHGLSEDEP